MFGPGITFGPPQRDLDFFQICRHTYLRILDQANFVLSAARPLMTPEGYRRNLENARYLITVANTQRIKGGQTPWTEEEIKTKSLQLVRMMNYRTLLTELSEYEGFREFDPDDLMITYEWNIVDDKVVLDIEVPEEIIRYYEHGIAAEIVDSRTLRLSPRE